MKIQIFSKTLLSVFLMLFVVSSFMPGVYAMENEESVEIIFFHSETCPVCAKERPFLEQLQANYPMVVVDSHEVKEDGALDYLKSLYQQHQVPEKSQGLVPVTFIDNQVYIGFSQNTEDKIIEQIRYLLGEDVDIDGFSGIVDQSNDFNDGKLSIPFTNFEFNLVELSPFALSAAVGALDGFNACAMIALGILLAIVVSTGVRKRVIIIGGTFILVSGLVYYVFIAAWLNVFLFLGYLKIITYIVGISIILFAAFLLKDYFNNVICKVCNVDGKNKGGFLIKAQQYLFDKANKTVSSDMPLIWMVLGIAVIAAGINMVELFCSLGFPLAYTKVLVGYNLPTLQYYLYLLVYVAFYMLDDFLIFLVAVFTLRITGVSEKYLKFVKLISGIVLIILGLIMLFKPELLTF